MAGKLEQIVPGGYDRRCVPAPRSRDQATQHRPNPGSRRSAAGSLHTEFARRDEGRELVRGKIDLNRYLDHWLTLAARPRLRTKSYCDYDALCSRYIRPALGCRSLRELDPLDLQWVYQGMIERGLSPRTIHYTHAVLRSALEQAVRWRLLATNPADGVALPKLQRRPPSVLSIEESRHFLTVALKTRYGVAFAMALTTGLRPSELLALRWSDVNWAGQAITVARTLEKGNGWQFSGVKRPASRRQIQLQGWIFNLLAKLHARNLTISFPAPDQIFQTRCGRPLNSDYLARQLKKILHAAGLPDIRLYDLRHSAASLALAAGVPVKVISEQLGHANSAFTLDTYAHLLPHMQAEAVQRVEALLGMAREEKKTVASACPAAEVAIALHS